MLHFFNRAAKIHEKFLHRAKPKDGLCFRNWLWLRGAALTCSCSSWHRIHTLCLAYSLFTPYSSVAIEASPTVASLPSPKALGMLPVEAIFIRRKRCGKKARCTSGLLYLHCVTPREVRLNWCDLLFQIPACQQAKFCVCFSDPGVTRLCSALLQVHQVSCS